MSKGAIEAGRASQRVNAPRFGLCAAVCDLSSEAECVPTLDGDSERRPFVGDYAKGNKADLISPDKNQFFIVQAMALWQGAKKFHKQGILEW